MARNLPENKINSLVFMQDQPQSEERSKIFQASERSDRRSRSV